MRNPDFLQALQIIQGNHSTKLIINHCKPGGQVPAPENPKIHIIGCCATVINNLINAGYTLSMEEGMLQVDKY